MARQKTARVKDKWREKKWVTVLLPASFDKKPIAYIPVTDDDNAVGRVIEVTLHDILKGDPSQHQFKLYFQIPGPRHGAKSNWEPRRARASGTKSRRSVYSNMLVKTVKNSGNSTTSTSAARPGAVMNQPNWRSRIGEVGEGNRSRRGADLPRQTGRTASRDGRQEYPGDGQSNRWIR